MKKYVASVRIELGFELEFEFPNGPDPDPTVLRDHLDDDVPVALPDGLVLPDGVAVEDIVVWNIDTENGDHVYQR